MTQDPFSKQRMDENFKVDSDNNQPIISRESTTEEYMRVINIDCNENIECAFKKIIEALGYSIENTDNSKTVFICKRGEDIKKRGYHIPDVFIFQQENHGENFYHDFFWDVDAVRTRLASFKQCENHISKDDLKDWCIGALRMKLGLDEYCHGVTSCNPLKNPEVLIKNAKKVDDALLEEWFQKELEELKELKPDDIAEFLKKIEPRGSQVRFLKPFGKLNALLIDDEPLENEAQAEWKNNLNIEPLIFAEEKKNKKYKIEWLIEKLDSSRYQFDVILLDLCIKDELNDDPTGYTFLPVLRQFFPLTPIIVYSSFTDMGHISRAFRDGATWYLRKENKHKLARHIVSIFSHPQWEREWSAIKENYSFKPEKKDQALDDIDKFLIASPTKNLPGNEIKWKQTNEGASSSKTYIIGKDYSKAVVKIDAPAKTKSEYDRYQRFIRPYLDNNAGRIYTPPVIADYQKSAIAYTFAGSASCEIKIFRERIKKALCGKESIEKITKNINDLYDNLISQLHRVKIEQQDEHRDEHRDYPNLFYYETEKQSGTYAMKMPNENIINAQKMQNDYDSELKMFISRGISRGKNSVHFFDCNDLTPYKIQGDLIRTAGMHELNPFIFKLKSKCVPVDKLQNNLREFFDDEHRTKNIDVSIVHGDLNTGNIMLEEGSDKIWLIDFAVTHRDTPIIDYTVLYYSVLRDLRDILCVKPSADNFIQLILSSLRLDNNKTALRLSADSTLEHCKWKNAAVLLTHITSKVPEKWLPAYQCGVAMSLIYGTRNLIDRKDTQKDWSKIAKAAAAAITKSLLAKSEA